MEIFIKFEFLYFKYHNGMIYVRIVKKLFIYTKKLTYGKSFGSNKGNLGKPGY